MVYNNVLAKEQKNEKKRASGDFFLYAGRFRGFDFCPGGNG
jgi:hypothetical protein